MSVEKRNKSKSVTYDQKSTMVDFLKNHEELAKGKHSSTFTQAIAKQQWEELTGIFNSIPGPCRFHWFGITNKYTRRVKHYEASLY